MLLIYDNIPCIVLKSTEQEIMPNGQYKMYVQVLFGLEIITLVSLHEFYNPPKWKESFYKFWIMKNYATTTYNKFL